MRVVAFILTCSLLIGCDSRATGPAPIGADDACASCRMLISEHRYAAELLDEKGNLYKFDDVACMLRFAHEHGKQAPAVRFYVVDSAGGDWLDARQASFVKLGTSVSSPMASGLAAYRRATDATRAAGRTPARPFSFDDLWGKDLNELNAAAEPAPAGSRSEESHGR